MILDTWKVTDTYSRHSLSNKYERDCVFAFSLFNQDPKMRVLVPKLYLQFQGLTVFFPALLVRNSSIVTLTISEVFSIHASSSDGETITWLIEARDTGDGIQWPAVIPSNTSFAILLSKPILGGMGIMTQIVDDENSKNDEISVRWRGMVSVNNAEEVFEDAGMEKGEESSLDGEYIPFRWWIVD